MASFDEQTAPWIIAKYDQKLREGVLASGASFDFRGLLVQLYAEQFGAFCDNLAKGFAAWSHEGAKCPQCRIAVLKPMPNAREWHCPGCGHVDTL